MKLENRVALITGGSRGIGSAIALAFAAEGADIVINYMTKDKIAEEVVSKIRKIGRKAIAIRADVKDFGAVEAMIKIAMEEFKKIDILINNAGIIKWKTLLKTPPEDWNLIIDTDLKGVFNCVKCLIPPMINNKFGKIINISSTFAFFGRVGTVPYSAAKAGIIGLTRSLAKELGPCGINVNAIAPGYVMTDLTSQVSEEDKRLTISAIPLRRPAEPDEIANVAVFLATKESSYITGQVIFVDGGWTL